MEAKAPLKLLVVDDEAVIVEMLQKIYSRRGFITFGATDGPTAVAIFKKEKPWINLIDVYMPYSSIDGIETLRQIKEIDKDALCIMVTRISEEEKVKMARQCGACAYVLKPLELEELDQAICEAGKLDPKILKGK